MARNAGGRLDVATRKQAAAGPAGAGAIIGGVPMSTLLTLVVVPVLYSDLVRERRPVA